SPRFRVLGAVSASEPAAFRLTMNGLTVDYARATLLPAGAILLFERGDFVDVKGAVDAATGLFVATSVEQRRKRLDGAVEGRADIEGLLTKIDSTDPTRFEVNGLPVSTTAATAFAGTLSTRSTVTVKGVVTSAGTVAASTVKAVPLPFGPPVPAAVSNNLRIRVRDAAGAPQGGTQVSLWVQSSSVGYSYAWATGANTTTDAAGNLLASTPEGANVSAYAARSGYQQPCVASTTISGGSVLDVQLVPAASLLASNSPAPFSTGGVVISGTVFETVAGARRPVPGALVWFESLSDLVSATTLTDLEGRYVLCRLPPQVSASELWVTKSGYADLEVWPIDTRQSGTRDLELTRVP
ncbi:MAG: carboxypeptidase regulatory-like domain-containing protein, partial [Myxococcales bacterium]